MSVAKIQCFIIGELWKKESDWIVDQIIKLHKRYLIYKDNHDSLSCSLRTNLGKNIVKKIHIVSIVELIFEQILEVKDALSLSKT